MKKEMLMLLLMILVIGLTGCDYEEDSEEFIYDRAVCKPAWRSETCYAFDSKSNKAIKVIRDHGKYSYHEGTYSGDLDNEFEVDFGSIYAPEFKDGVCKNNCSDALTTVKHYLQETSYFSK